MSDPLTIVHGDALSSLQSMESESVQCVVTSPPYWGLRDYGTATWEGGDVECSHAVGGQVQDSKAPGAITTGQRPGVDASMCRKCGARRIDIQIGLEKTPEEYVARLVEVFAEVKRVLRKDGTVFLNLGDSYYGSWGNYGGQNTGNGKQRKIKSGSQVPNPAYDGLEGFRPPTAGARREVSYGTSDKALEDSPKSDCLCQSLCDACRVAYQIGKSHSGRWHDPKRVASPSAPTRDHRESAPDHSPTSDSSLPVVHSADAIQGFESCVDLALEPLPVSQASTIGESSLPLPEGSHLSGLPLECQLCGRSLLDLTQTSERKKACTCGTSQMSSSSADRIHKGCSDDPYPDCTTAYRSPILKPKDLVGVPWMVAFALRADGWYLRSDIIWSKPNPMPESVTDRPTKSHEYIFLLSKSQRYYYDGDAVREPYSVGSLGRYAYEFGNGPAAAMAKSPAVGNGNGHNTEPNPLGRNRRSVWSITTHGYPDAHFATFPPELIKPCILAGSRCGDLVVDPFAGSGTTGKVAIELGRKACLIEPKAEYIEMIKKRCQTTIGLPL